jgi:outer membrane protein assembly factor BamB
VASLPAWTTYHHDAARSGVDPDSTSPVPPTQIWQSAALDGKVWAEPLAYGNRVYVATENDTVYALDASTGAIVWQNHLATAVPSSGTSSQIACSDVKPIVGITSTPVIDPSRGLIYVAADTWDGSNPASIAHKMYALNLGNGSVAGSPVAVDPPLSVPADQLQRVSLALDAGKVLIGYGSNGGDCGTYHGWLVAVPEGGGSLQTFEADSGPGELGGAIWAGGNAPAIDASGEIWIATGNGNSTNYDYQDSVIELDSNLNVLGFWAPSNWSTLDQSDGDLGSAMPVLLPGGLAFMMGKEGGGILLSASSLVGPLPGGSPGQPPRFHANVCPAGGNRGGGGIYYNGVIYVTCMTTTLDEGMYALALDPGTPSFTPVPGWTPEPNAIGPPIEAGGLIWSAGYHNGDLYGLDPKTGATKFSTSLGGFEHFSTPSAGGGLLFVANHDQSVSGADQVTAFRIAKTPTDLAISSSSNPSKAGQAVTYSASVSPTPDAGTIGFTDGGQPIPGCSGLSIGASGQASCTTTPDGAGAHTITAAYSGDAFYSASSASLSQSVTPLPPPPTISRLHVRVVHGKLRLRLTLSEPSRLTVLVFRLAQGRMVHHRCREGAKHGLRCLAMVRKLKRHRFAANGLNAFRLRMRPLPPGSYLVIVTASNSFEHSMPNSRGIVVGQSRRPRPLATTTNPAASLAQVVRRFLFP